ncbi:MAG: PTS transporter subunit EIIC [Oscillospiraceae bacterium]|nr:PTS transporter subunit EIIC [Oscillospiraceae bacterium]
MNGIVEKITKFTQAKYMKILTNGFMNVAAITIAGSIFTLVKSLPIPVWQTFLTGSGLGDILSIPVSVTSDLMAMWVALGMGAAVAKEFNKDKLACALVALGSFMVLTPFVGTLYAPDYSSATPVPNVIPVSSLGAQGIFLAMIAGILGARLYAFLIDKDIKLNMPDSVPPNVAGMFEMMIPAGVVFLVFLAARWGFSLTSYGTAQQFIYKILQTPIMAVGGGIAGVLVYLTLSKLLWVFGVHGGMVCYSAMAVIIGTASAANAAAFAAGTAVPYPEWSWAMAMLMDFPVLPLGLVMVIFAKSQQYKTLSRIALPTALFNISEPQVFGIPLVMNPVMAVPFVLLQPINFLLTMFAMNIGFLAPPTGAGINNFMPTIIVGPLVNAHWSGAVWVIILLAINFVAWIPFFKIIDKKACEQEAAAAVEAPQA